MRRCQQGLSLIEVIFSLGIMAIIFAVVADYYYSQNKRYLEVSKAVTQIQQLASVSYEWQAAQSQTDFNGISLSVLQQAGLLAAIDSYSQIDPWGGTMSLAADEDPRYVLITLPKIPADVCSNLYNRMSTLAHHQECSAGNYSIAM